MSTIKMRPIVNRIELKEGSKVTGMPGSDLDGVVGVVLIIRGTTVDILVGTELKKGIKISRLFFVVE